MTAIPIRFAAISLLVCMLLSIPGATVEADEDTWSVVVTPQLWVTHIASNGFTAPGGNFGVVLINPFDPTTAFTNIFRARSSTHVGAISPQPGIQISARKQRWTLAGSLQYVEFKMRNDIIFDPPVNLGARTPTGDLFPGDLAARESVTTKRFDVDLAVRYSFPDLVKDWLDVSVGGGVKLIYADATRHYGNVNKALAAPDFGGLYTRCARDTCEDAVFLNHASTKSWVYGATLPAGAVFHLAKRWFLPLGVTPFLGAETRDDRNILYALTPDPSPLGEERVKRLDGTTFAYGVTTDLHVLYVFDPTMLAYAGMRVQYIRGHERYLAYGPVFGVSLRVW